MAGPAAGLKNISGSMAGFGKAVHDLERNMRLGLKPQEIMKFFQSVGAGGMSLQGLITRVGDYGTTIDSARRMSLQFGVSLEEMGGMMSSQMLNLRSSLEDVRDTFKNLSYDAAQAGIQSQKFYQTIEAASLSLSYYGNFLKETSGRLRDLVQVGNMGFKDAAEHATNMMGLFKDMSLEQRRSLVSVLGIKTTRKLYQGVADQIGESIGEQSKKIIELQGNLKKAGLGSEERKIVEGQLKAAKLARETMRAQRAPIARTAKEGGITELGMRLPALAAQTPGVMLDVMKGLGIDVFMKDMDALQSSLAHWNMQNEDTLKMVDQLRNSAGFMSALMGEAGDNLAKTRKENVASFALMADIIEEFRAGGSETYKTMEDVRGEIERMMGSMKDLKPEDIELFMLNVRQSMEGAAAFASKGRVGLAGNIRKFAEGGVRNAPAERGRNFAKEQQDELIKQTTAFADYVGISKESLAYTLASTKGAKTMAAGINIIAQKTVVIAQILEAWSRRKEVATLTAFEAEKEKGAVDLRAGYKTEYALKMKIAKLDGKTDADSLAVLAEARKDLASTQLFIKDIERDKRWENITGHFDTWKQKAIELSIEEGRSLDNREKIAHSLALAVSREKKLAAIKEGLRGKEEEGVLKQIRKSGEERMRLEAQLADIDAKRERKAGKQKEERAKSVGYAESQQQRITKGVKFQRGMGSFPLGTLMTVGSGIGGPQAKRLLKALEERKKDPEKALKALQEASGQPTTGIGKWYYEMEIATRRMLGVPVAKRLEMISEEHFKELLKSEKKLAPIMHELGGGPGGPRLSGPKGGGGLEVGSVNLNFYGNVDEEAVSAGMEKGLENTMNKREYDNQKR